MKVNGDVMTFSDDELDASWKILTDPNVWLREDFKAAISRADAELTASRAIVQAAREYANAEVAWWTYVNTDASYFISGDLPLQKARDAARNALFAAVGGDDADAR